MLWNKILKSSSKYKSPLLDREFIDISKNLKKYIQIKMDLTLNVLKQVG